MLEKWQVDISTGLLGGLQQEQMQRLGMLGDIGRQQQMPQQALQVPYQEFQRALAFSPNNLVYYKLAWVTPLETVTTQQKTGTGDILGS